MTQSTLIQELIASLDLYLPWLLPALETVEQTVPATVRFPIGVLLMVWVAVLRQRDPASAAGHLHRVAL